MEYPKEMVFDVGENWQHFGQVKLPRGTVSCEIREYLIGIESGRKLPLADQRCAKPVSR